MSAFATLGALQEHGYRASLDLSELVVKGPSPIPEDLRREIAADTPVIKAAVLLSNPPSWLRLVLDRYVSGHTVTNKKGLSFHISLENVCANVAAAIDIWTHDERGQRVLDLARVRPEVEAVARSWKPPKKMKVLVYD